MGRPRRGGSDCLAPPGGRGDGREALRARWAPYERSGRGRATGWAAVGGGATGSAAQGGGPAARAGGRWERAPAAHSPGLGRRRPPPGRASGQRGAAATRRLCNGGGGTHRGGGGRSRRGKRNRRAWPQPARAGRCRRDYGTRQPSAARGPTGNAVRRARRESGFGKSALPSAPLPFPIARSYPTRCHKPTRLRLLLQPALSTLSPLPFSPQAHLFTR